MWLQNSIWKHIKKVPSWKLPFRGFRRDIQHESYYLLCWALWLVALCFSSLILHLFLLFAWRVAYPCYDGTARMSIYLLRHKEDGKFNAYQ